MMLMLSVHPSLEKDLETPDTLVASSGAQTRSFIDLHGNRCTRLLAPPGPTTLSADFVIHSDGLPDPVLPEARLAPIDDLPPCSTNPPGGNHAFVDPGDGDIGRRAGAWEHSFLFANDPGVGCRIVLCSG